MLVQHRCARLERYPCIDDRRQRLVVDLHQLERILR
jgi:hypothetical protein